MVWAVAVCQRVASSLDGNKQWWLCGWVQAVYHRYARETQKELQALMGSEQWDAAHQLLMNDLAPDWLLAGESVCLSQLFSWLRWDLPCWGLPMQRTLAACPPDLCFGSSQPD